MTISELLSKNKIKYDDNFAVINTTNQINSNISNLDSNYKENNGLLIKVFTYNNNIFNSYIENYTKFFKFLIEILSLPNVSDNYFINVNNYTDTNTAYTLEKSLFNNIPIIIEFIETLGTLDLNEIEKIYSNNISKNTQGNFPSILFPLHIDQINKMVKNNLFSKHYENKIPLIIPWGLATPEILYKKYIWDKTTLIDINRTIESYIINNGPSYLDELSAYLEFIKINKLYKLYKNDNTKFQEYQSYENNGKYIGGPKLGTPEYNQGNNYLINYEPYSNDYKVDISNEIIFYIGIDNDYGWNHPKLFFQKVANKFYEINISAYDSDNNIDVKYRKNNVTDLSYDNFIDDILNNITYLTNNNTLMHNNPDVFMIKIPYYQTQEEYETNIIGNGVLDAWVLIKKYISNNNLDLLNTHIYLRNYSKESDLVSLKFLYDNSFLIPNTCGSIYDFLEENFNDEYFEYKYIFSDLKCIRSFNAYAYDAFNSYITKYNSNTNKINNLTNINEIYNNFDQLKFYEMLTNSIHINLLINNVQINKGILVNNEDLNINYRIYSGKDIFDNNVNFNYNNLCSANGASNGIGENKLLFGDLISSTWNNGLFWDISNGYPFNRNTSYLLLKRDFNLNLYHSWNLLYRRLNSSTSTTADGDSLFISSQYELINSIIFEINNDLSNSNYHYNKFKDLYSKNTLIYDISDSLYSLIHYLSNITLTQNNINLNDSNSKALIPIIIENIKEIYFGNYIYNISDFNNLNNLQKIFISKNINAINNGCFANCTNLLDISFENITNLKIVGSYAFKNCINLVNLNLPDNIVFMYSNCFENCSALENINIPLSVSSLYDNLFLNCQSLISINIPSNVTQIYNNCFENCININSIIFQENSLLKTIGNSAFKNCQSLTNIILPNNLESLGDNCFLDCSGLINIVLNNKLKNIGNNCFKNCNSLFSINLENTTITKLLDNTFINCISIEFLILPKTLNVIQQNVFSNTNIKELYIIDQVVEISNNIFNNISNNITLYYFSNLIDTNTLLNLPVNKTLVDLYNNPPDPSFNFKYNNITIEWFLYKIICSFFDRIYCSFNISMTTNHYNGYILINISKLF